MRALPPHGVTALQMRTKRLATCWKIERTDSTIHKFTDHNALLVLSDGNYHPTQGISTSARQQRSGLEENNFEIRGVISSATVNANDIRSGRFRNAKVTEMLVDWAYPFYGAIITNVYFIEQTVHNGETWEAQVSGIPAKLKREIGSIFSRNCAWTLGDSKCQFDVASLQETGREVQSITDLKYIFTGNMAISTTGYWDYGILTWTTGLNTGLSFEIEKNVGQLLTLRFYMPYPIFVGDDFTIKPGCNKLIQTCKDKFNNVINFGGFPTIPGNDKLIQGPDNSADALAKKF